MTLCLQHCWILAGLLSVTLYWIMSVDLFDVSFSYVGWFVFKWWPFVLMPCSWFLCECVVLLYRNSVAQHRLACDKGEFRLSDSLWNLCSPPVLILSFNQGVTHPTHHHLHHRIMLPGLLYSSPHHQPSPSNANPHCGHQGMFSLSPVACHSSYLHNLCFESLLELLAWFANHVYAMLYVICVI